MASRSEVYCGRWEKVFWAWNHNGRSRCTFSSCGNQGGRCRRYFERLEREARGQRHIRVRYIHDQGIRAQRRDGLGGGDGAQTSRPETPNSMQGEQKSPHVETPRGSPRASEEDSEQASERLRFSCKRRGSLGCRSCLISARSRRSRRRRPMGRCVVQ